MVFAQFDYTVNARGDRATAAETVRKADGTNDAWTYSYTYDALARVRDAHAQQSGTVRRFQYAFDLAGNRTQQSITIGAGSPTTTNWTYNAGNQISNSGYTYDNNGNLTNDGVITYTWDRANRLLNVGAAGANVSKYDGLGNRVSRTNSGFTTNLLQDMQPGLAQNVAIGYPSLGNMARMVHTPFGLLAQEDNAGNWEWMLGDGLGSVRSVVDNMLTVNALMLCWITSTPILIMP